jgi:uncharacterized caspase-like protein
LAPIRNPSGLIIAYATQYLSTAADDAGRASGHSPFTVALLNNIATPGLDVTDMLRKVGREVDAASGGKQRPEISLSIYEQYVLVPAAATPEQARRPAPSDGAGNATPPAVPAVDEVAWSFLKDSKDAELLRRFIGQYPTSPRRHEAEDRLNAVEQTPAMSTVPQAVAPPGAG